MKILIVDDELLVRIGIKSCIEWQKYDMEVVGEATDGVEALQMIRSLKPDAVLLDLKMPNMDGLEVMAGIKEEKLPCRVVILSGFDDIFHVKEAMKLGAVDYLHKPCMNPKDVVDILMGIKEQMKREDRSSIEMAGFKHGSNMSRDAFLQELLEGCLFSEGEFKQKCNEHGIRLENGCFSCIVFTVKGLAEVKKRYEGGDMGLLKSSILNIVRGVFQKEEGIEILSADSNNFVIIMGMKGIISERKIMDGIDETIKFTIDAMRQFLNIDVVLGISDIHIGFKEIKRAYDEASGALKHKFYSSARNIIYYRDIRNMGRNESISRVDLLIESLKGLLTKGEYRRFRETLSELMEVIREDRCLSEEDVKKLFNAFLFLMREGKTGLEEMELLNKCETIEQLYETWEAIIGEKFEEGQHRKRYSSCSFLVKGIIAHIDEKYNQDLTLNSLAEKFNVTPNYISRVFREETGEALFNYINLVRIEKAKEFLKESGVKIYEVGFKVGFKSSVHFNIVFNRLAGLSPKQYRDSL